MTWSELDDLAIQWDRECLRHAKMAVDPDQWENSHFNIERAYQFAMVANALHRMKDRAEELATA